MRIVFTGSGSGGHFYPLIAIAGALRIAAANAKERAPEFFLLAPTEYDAGALFAHEITFVRVPAGKVRRYFSFRNFLDAFKTLWGIFVAIWQLFRLYPDAVMSKGSYTSTPVVIAAWLLRIPVVVHESDVRPGRANKLASWFAHTIATSYEGSAAYFPPARTVRTGMPVRRELLSPYPGNAAEHLGIAPHRPLILVLGGSQGAERVNDLIITALDELLPTYTIVHQTGEQNAQLVTETAHALTEHKDLLAHYHVRGFLDSESMAAAFSAASLVISRAGSGTIYEIALSGKPAILIPIPEEISHDQRINAYEYARAGGASVMEEANLTPNLLVAEVTRIMGDQALQLTMQEAARGFAPRDAAEKVGEVLRGIAQAHE